MATEPAAAGAASAAANDDEVVLAIPPVSCLEEFLNYPHAALILTQYLLSTGHSDDDVLFWSTCRDFRESAPTASEDELHVMATRIFNTFVKDGAPNRVKIDYPVLIDLAEARLWRPTPDLFDNLTGHILDRMERDIYPDFSKSQTYAAVIKATAARLPWKPIKRSKIDPKTGQPARLSGDVAGKLTSTPRGSQESIDKELRASRNMLKRLQVKARQSPVPMTPEQLQLAMGK